MIFPLRKLVDGKRVHTLLTEFLLKNGVSESDTWAIGEMFGWWFSWLTIPEKEGGATEIYQQIMLGSESEEKQGAVVSQKQTIDFLSRSKFEEELTKMAVEIVGKELTRLEPLLEEIGARFRKAVQDNFAWRRVTPQIHRLLERFCRERPGIFIGIPHTEEEFLPALIKAAVEEQEQEIGN